MAGYAQYVGNNRIVNSTGTSYVYGNSISGNPTYYTNIQGVPVATHSVTGQPKVIGGASTFIGGDRAGPTSYVSANLNNVILGGRLGYLAGSRAYRGFMNGTTMALTTQYLVTGVGISGQNAVLYSGAATNPRFVAGQNVYFGPTGAVAPGSGQNSLFGSKTILGASATAFITNESTGQYHSLFQPTTGPAFYINVQLTGTTFASTGPVTYQGSPNAGTRQFIGQKLVGMTIAGVASQALLGAGNYGSYTRSINKREKLRTTKVTAGMRTGQYNRFSGKWVAVPAISEDGATVGLAYDTAANVNPNAAAGIAPSTNTVTLPGGGTTMKIMGFLTYKSKGNVPVTVTYKAKTGTTTWYNVARVAGLGNETFTAN